MANKADRPNIILIQTDQQSASTLGLYGNSVVRTPALEKIANEGVLFNYAYCNYPACVPSRASMMTGRYPHTLRSHANFMHLNPEEISLPFVLKENGYSTALIGKNHAFIDGRIANAYTDLPNGKSSGVKYNHLHDVFDYVLEANHINIHGYEDDEEVRSSCDWARKNCWGNQHTYGTNPYSYKKCTTQLLGDRAVEYIRDKKNGDKPFFLWLSFPDPHTPYQVPEPYASMYRPEEVPAPIVDDLRNKPENQRIANLLDSNDKYDEQHFREIRAIHYGMINFIDDNIKRVMDTLESLGIKEDTIILFTADHGDSMGDHGIIQKHNFFYDSFTRVPFIVSWGTRFKHFVSDNPVELVDVMPTLLDLGGVDIPYGVQGKSLAPLLQGKEYTPKEFIIMESGENEKPLKIEDVITGGEVRSKSTTSAWCAFKEAWQGKGKSIRTVRWKLNVYLNGEGELYDLENDQNELNNLYGQDEYKHMETDLKIKLLMWCMENEDKVPQNRTVKLSLRGEAIKG